MKSYLLLVTLLIIIFCHWSSASSTGLERRKTAVLRLLGRRLQDVWSWLWRKEDHLAERCFGVARRLKFAMPMIIFKLGVIVTILAFLTIFSLKSLALLILLVMLNSGGVAAKWAQVKLNSAPIPKPQNVHVHVHSKDGHYVSHHDYDHGWHDKSQVLEPDEYESIDERLKKLSIYENFYNKLR